MKRIILLVLVLCTFMLSVNSVYAENDMQGYVVSDSVIRVNGDIVNFVNSPIDMNGNIMVPANTVFQSLGASVNWYPGNGRIKIIGGNIDITMRIGDRSVFVNGVRKRIDVPPVLANGAVMLPVKQVADALNARVGITGKEISIDAAYKRMKIVGNKSVPFVVVVDAGHGGKDPGAVKAGVREKDLNLDIAKRLNQLLKLEGIKTYMTRVDDRYVGLYDRSALANKVNADLLISVHNNSGSSGAWGSMSLFYPGTKNYNGGLTAQKFAAIVQKEMTAKLSTRDWGEIERPKLAVLRTSKMPAVIAEVGYMSNSRELKNLLNPIYRQNAAEALKDAVLKSLDKI